MGKGEMSNSSAEVIDSSTLLAKTTAEASKMLEAALLQMDGIISGTLFCLTFTLFFFHLVLEPTTFNLPSVLVSLNSSFIQQLFCRCLRGRSRGRCRVERLG